MTVYSGPVFDMAVNQFAVIADHLTSPSGARAVSPEDFAGACAPCGAPCPSAGKR